MSRRSYHQFCGLAGALDVVGERWTLLIVRDLSGGPRRYSDLAASLEGIGTSLLALRLKQLESDKVIARRYLPPPAASTVYELTHVGWELLDALVPLVVWGARHGLTENRPRGERFRPEWSLAVLARTMQNTRDEAAPAATIEFVIDGEPAVVTVDRQSSAVSLGRASGLVDASVATDSATLASVVGGRIELGDALADGRIQADGDNDALVALATALSAVRRPAG